MYTLYNKTTNEKVSKSRNLDYLARKIISKGLETNYFILNEKCERYTVQVLIDTLNRKVK